MKPVISTRLINLIPLLWLLAASLCVGVGAGDLTSIDEIALDQTLTKPRNLASHFYYLKDPGGHLKAEDLLHNLSAYPWQENHKNKVDFSFTEDTYWFYTNIQHHNRNYLKWLMEINAPLTDSIDIYIIRSDNTVNKFKVGDLLPQGERPIKHRNFLIPIDLAPNEKIKVLLRVQDSDELRFDCLLWQPTVFWQKEQGILLMLGLFYGMMLLLILYNGFVYITTRVRSFASYILFVISSTLFISVQQGLAYEWLWPDLPYWHEKSDPFFAITTALTAFLFLCDFLQLKDKHQLTYRFLAFNMIALLVALIMNFMLQHNIAVRLTLLFLFPCCLISALVCVRLALRGYLNAQLFATAWLFLGIGGIVQITNSVGYIPSNIWTDNAFIIGNTIHVFLQALALAQRLKKIEADKIKALSMSEAKSEFLAKMSHEIRTPMNGVLGIVELMKDTGLNKQQQRYMDVINASGRSLLSIINDILDYSKIEAGRMELDQSPFNISRVIEDVTPLFTTYLQQQAINLNVYISSDLPAYVIGDADRLRQVLINLLGNSFKFTQEGTITITVHPDASSPQHIYFAVSDSGHGIPPADQKQLFEAFYQARSSQGGSIQGTGLGLTICKQIVDLMGGDIGLKSEPGAGSTFWFSVPMPAAEESELAKLAANTSQFISSHSLHILVAEDNNTNQLIIRNLLSKLGHNVTIVENGHQAVAAVQQRGMDFDLVLMDHEMPEMDGLEAAKAIRCLPSDYAQITIIALTAHSTKEEKQRCFDAGMDDYLSKPVDYGLLKEKLQQLILERNTHSENTLSNTLKATPQE